MKKRLHNKAAGIVILVGLFLISLIEFIFRSACLREIMFSTKNSGEPFATMLFAALLLFFTFMGKDRICYICFGVWIGCFAMDQIIGLPGMVSDMIRLFKTPGSLELIGDINVVLRILSMITIIAIGVLLVEYMNDGSIFNKAFNILCIATVLFILASIVIAFYTAITADKMHMLDVFNQLYRLGMVFMSTFFAYDAAKHQLKKANLSK